MRCEEDNLPADELRVQSNGLVGIVIWLGLLYDYVQSITDVTV